MLKVKYDKDEIKAKAKTMTRKGFMKFFYKKKDFCPDEISLERIECGLIEPCKECQRNSVRGLRFLDKNGKLIDVIKNAN